VGMCNHSRARPLIGPGREQSIAMRLQWCILSKLAPYDVSRWSYRALSATSMRRDLSIWVKLREKGRVYGSKRGAP